jgi:hypothetical protein
LAAAAAAATKQQVLPAAAVTAKQPTLRSGTNTRAAARISYLIEKKNTEH